MTKLIKKVWCFSIVTDGANHMDVGYLDLRCSFGIHGKVYNLHGMAIPIGERRHTAAEYYDVVTEFLIALSNKKDELYKR